MDYPYEDDQHYVFIRMHNHHASPFFGIFTCALFLSKTLMKNSAHLTNNISYIRYCLTP